jgi:putative spermidine/putrescine transport system permease protein
MDGDGQKAGVGTWAFRVTCAAVFAFLIGPVLVILVVSFNGSHLMSFPPKIWALGWYRHFLLDPEWRRSIVVSIKVGGLTTLMATTLGFFAALALIRGKFRGKTAIYGLMLTPMIVPTIISAIAYYIAFAKMGVTGSVFAMALGHTVLALPVVIVILTASMRNLDESYERAALSLGAGRFYTLRRVTVPLAAPMLVSAALLAFLSSFDELLVSLFLAGVQSQTLPVRIWNSLMMEVDPTVAAVSASLILLTVLILCANIMLRQSGKP